MKLVTLVVKPFLLADVVAAAMEAGAGGATVSEVKGFGRQGGHSETYRGSEYRIEMVPKSCIEVRRPRRQGRRGAGRHHRGGPHRQDRRRQGCGCATSSEVVRVRTGETGADAV